MELEIKNNKNRSTRTSSFKKGGAGFTLIELLVALVVFSLVILSMSVISVSVIKAQRRVFGMQNIRESASYILEIMNKEIRTSEINSASGNGLALLNITNSNGDDIDYQFTGDKIQRRINGGVWQDLSPSNIGAAGAFYITNEVFPARVIVTTAMSMKIENKKTEEEFEMNLQSTITPRQF